MKDGLKKKKITVGSVANMKRKLFKQKENDPRKKHTKTGRKKPRKGKY